MFTLYTSLNALTIKKIHKEDKMLLQLRNTSLDTNNTRRGNMESNFETKTMEEDEVSRSTITFFYLTGPFNL